MAKRSATRLKAQDAKGKFSTRRGEAIVLGLFSMLMIAWPILATDGDPSGIANVFSVLSLGLAAIACLVNLGNYRSEVRWKLIDLAFLVFTICYVVSGLIRINQGLGTNVISNAFWQWLGTFSIYFIARLCIVRAEWISSYLLMFSALMLALSLYGFYQHQIELPSIEADLLNSEPGLLSELPTDPVARESFAARIRSKEIFSTYALANSFAVVLSTFIAVQILFGVQGIKQLPPGYRVLFVIGIILQIGALYLTKSRTGILSLLAGVTIGLSLHFKNIGREALFKVIVGFVCLLGLGIGIGFLSGAFDSVLESGAGQSLKYRFEYWEASWEMAMAQPVFGTGPGLFKDVYTQFKLPLASEEISDPHNMFLEVLATSGFLGLLTWSLFIGFVLLLVFRLTKGLVPRESSETEPENKQDTGNEKKKSGNKDKKLSPEAKSIAPASQRVIHVTAFIVIAGIIGLYIGIRLNSSISLTLTMTTMLVLALSWPIALLWAWHVHKIFYQDENQTKVALVAGVVTFAVNLLAAGGFSFTAVNSFGVFLIVSLITLAGTATETETALPKKIHLKGIGTVIFGILCLLCFFTSAQPTIQRLSLSDEAFEAQKDGAIDAYLESILLAHEADPTSVEPVNVLTQFYFNQWLALQKEDFLQDPTLPEKTLKGFEKYGQLLVELRPLSAGGWYLVGKMYQQVHLQLATETAGQEAEKYLSKAVELNPNQFRMIADYALLLVQLGQEKEALEFARRALELEKNTPHQNLKWKKHEQGMVSKLQNLLENQAS